MSYTVSITSQGQVSIPMPIRKQFKLNEANKARVYIENERVIIEPIPDILSLGGSLAAYAKNVKSKTFDQMRHEYQNYLSERSQKRGSFPFPHVS